MTMENGISRNEIHLHRVQVIDDMRIFMKEQSLYLWQYDEIIFFLCEITPAITLINL